ncbi:MAG: 50S ribosomal protein L25/general stress protein Ctc, partial [Brachybacterium tyrofermentans]
MAENLNVELREDFGKGAARRLRVDGRIPAVLYGHGEAPLHLSLPGHETALIARNPNALLELKLADGTQHLALIK